MKRLLTIMPWRIFVPVMLVFGFGLSIWGGIYVMNSATKRWEKDLANVAEYEINRIGDHWYSLDGYLGGLANLFMSSQTVSDTQFNETAKALSANFKSIKGIVYLSAPTDKSREFLSYPNNFVKVSSEAAFRAAAAGVLPTIKSTEFAANGKMVNAAGQAALQPFLSGNYTNRVLFVLPVSSEMNNGWLIAQIDIENFLKRHFSPRSVEQVNVKMTLFDQDKVEVFAQTLFYYDLEQSIGLPFDKNVIVSWSNAEWLFEWSFDPAINGGPNWFGGLLMIFVGVGMTIVVGWVFWTQQTISKQVQQQVIERTNQLEQASRRFRLITDNAYDLISIVGVDRKFEYVNSAYHRVLGYSREELKGQDITRFVHPKDVDTFKRSLQDVSNDRNAAEVTFRMRHKKGHWLYLEAVAKGLHNTEWTLSNIVIHCRDITSRKMYADELARSEQRFRDFADSSADWLWEVNDYSDFTYVSPGVKSVLGFDPEEMVGQMKFESLFDQNTDPTRELIEGRIQRHQPYRDIEFWTQSKSAERVCLRISGVPVFDDKQQFRGYRGAASNITASKLDRDNMFRLATTDHLTGLLNRHRFVDELERTVNLARRHKTQGVLMFIDLDRFKEVNDTHGHDAGDAILRAVSEVLTRQVRSTDIVARLGGDEFAIIMHNIDLEQAREKTEDIIHDINQISIDYNGVNLGVTMSIGMVVYPQEDKNGAGLIMSADLAMYRAKDMGRNRMFIDTGDDAAGDFHTKDSVREQLKWLDRLRTALDNGSFEMHYQPLVPLGKNQKTIYEALIRLRDEEGRLGPPYLFIDAAEHFGLIQKLDLCVIERCFQTQEALRRDKGIEMDISINLSGRSISDVEMTNKLREIVDKYDINPKNFMFEVTETQALHDPAAVRNIDKIRGVIDDLRAMGFRFALDDFGGGFSSFSYIKKLNVDVLKIDGSFVKELHESEEDQHFVSAIARLAQGLGIETVAEFVENADIVDLLVDLGVDYAQGYHLSKPEQNVEEVFANFEDKKMADFSSKPKKKTTKKTAAKKKAAPKKKTG